MTENLIAVRCSQCNHKTIVSFSTVGTSHTCKNCHTILFRYELVRGYVYILSNPEMPKVLKIGYTKRTVIERVNELNSATGVPAPFKIEAYFLSRTPDLHEKMIHHRLLNYRRKSKEFFEITLGEALQVMELACGNPPYFLRDHSQNSPDSLNQNTTKECDPLPYEAERAKIFTSLKQIQEEGGCDNFVVFTVSEKKNFFLQFSGQIGENILYGEAVGNAYLEEEYALSQDRILQLLSTGWNEPTKECPNFSKEWKATSNEDRTKIAEEVLQTFIEIYGWTPELPISVQLEL